MRQKKTGGVISKTKEGKEGKKTHTRSSFSSRFEDDVAEMWIQDEVARLKSRKPQTESPVHYVNGKLVIKEDSDSSSDDELNTLNMNDVEKAIYYERKRVGIKKAPKQDCTVM